MSSEKPRKMETRVVHAGLTPESWEGATLPPIFQNVAHLHETAESLSDTFAGKRADHVYMRLSNPTNRALEEKLKDLEGGKGAIVMSSGMAAISNSCMALLRSGDEFVTGNSLFMSTYVLFQTVFRKYGISARMADPTDSEAIRQAINEKTRFVYLETIGNPKMDVPDLARVAEIAHGNGLPLVVDNTLATPYLCRPIELGADVVIHSTTKYLSGHGSATGGAVIDAGTFSWPPERFPDMEPFIKKKGEMAYLDRVWREHHINFGTTQAPLHSYLTMIGLYTLAIRMERQTANALAVARFLRERPDVAWVRYPGLEDHPQHETASRQFGGKGFGAMISFGLTDRNACFAFINNLRMISNLANLGDCKTLAIHPYSTQYVSFDETIRQMLSITPDMIRLSVGIEHIDDILFDLGQALDHV
ncbi:MAG: O-acetylhomoserine aminocarboxypropyltransferase/cysteine synthase [Deltaproteobacteria bacterium]|nr:O-acetylhomoserine aminocarboxypropyltransferase/cysteine synthase [Deltaproteobacteria bacterium]